MPYAMSAPLMTCIMSRLGETRTDPQQAEVEEPLFFMYLFILLYLIFYYYFIYIYKTDFYLKLILIETQREARIWHWPTYSVIKTFINELTHPVIKLIRCVTTSQDVKNTMVQHHLSLSRRNWI